jgi:hypothetical protein
VDASDELLKLAALLLAFARFSKRNRSNALRCRPKS